MQNDITINDFSVYVACTNIHTVVGVYCFIIKANLGGYLLATRFQNEGYVPFVPMPGSASALGRTRILQTRGTDLPTFIVASQ